MKIDKKKSMRQIRMPILAIIFNYAIYTQDIGRLVLDNKLKGSLRSKV